MHPHPGNRWARYLYHATVRAAGREPWKLPCRPGRGDPMSNEILLFILSAGSLLTPAALLVGAVMLLVGLRGRRTDNHPICRGCGFDVSGIPGVGLGPAAGLVPCPECGRDVSAKRRLRTGNRLRRPRFIASGAGLLMLGLVGVVSIGFAMSRGTAWVTVLPSWALTWEAASGDATRQRAALAELTARINRGALDGWVARRALAQASAAQADTATAWLVEWGDLVEAAWHHGLVEPADYREFIRKGVTITCRINPLRDSAEAASDQPIDVTPQLDASIARVGVATSVEVQAKLIEVRYGTQTVYGDGNQAEMLTLGPSRPVILLQQVQVDREQDPQPKVVVRLAVTMRGSEREAGTGGNEAESSQELEFTLDSPLASDGS